MFMKFENWQEQSRWKNIRLCLIVTVILMITLFPGLSPPAFGETRTETQAYELHIASIDGADIFIESLTVESLYSWSTSRTATVVIKNRGNETSSPYFLDFYKNRDTAPTPDMIGDQYQQITSMAPGETRTETFNFSATSGSSYAWAQAQTTQTRNGESPVYGPYHYYRGYLPPPPSPAEIVIESLNIEPSVSELGDELTYNIVIRNVGGDQTYSSFRVDYYTDQATAPTAGQTGQAYTVIGVGFAPGAYEVRRYKFTPSIAGTKQSWTQADTNNQVSGAVVEGPVPYDVVEASDTHQALINLSIGSRVVDESWNWEFKTGSNYSGSGVTKPVTWIVVAKHHYTDSPGVTLLAEELIGKYTFDNSTNHSHAGAEYGHSWWHLTGIPNATRGLRPWLNSSGIHEGEGFYQAFSMSFKEAIVPSQILTRRWSDGFEYWSSNNVFIPSTTELGDIEHLNTHEIGQAYPHFSGAIDADRIAELAGVPTIYWTRSPSTTGEGAGVRRVGEDGRCNIYSYANRSDRGVRPALTLSAHTPVSLAPTAGVYTIVPPPEEPFADIVIESFTIEPSISTLGTELTATLVVKNEGNVPNPSAAEVVLFWNRADPPESSEGGSLYTGLASHIDPGDTRTITRNFTPAFEGEKQAWAFIDTDQTSTGEPPVYGPVSYMLEAEEEPLPGHQWVKDNAADVDALALTYNAADELTGAFPAFGVWHYSGSWSQMVGNDAVALAYDSEGNLAGAFPGFGIWVYDGVDWEQLAANDAIALAYSADDELTASLPGWGVYRYDGNDWEQVTITEATALAYDDDGNLVASMPNGVYEIYSMIDWSLLSAVPASALAAGTDLAGTFPGFGIWVYDSGQTWDQLTGVDATSLAYNSNDDLTGAFGLFGVWYYVEVE